MSHDFDIRLHEGENPSEKIILSLVGNPLKAGMPVTIAIIGHSRAGKSVLGLIISDIIYRDLGIEFLDLVEDVVLIKPEHYESKVRALLEGRDPLLKKACTIQMDEAKFLLDSSDWQSLKSKVIRTIAATSATIKPILFIIVAQMLSDIDPKTRRTIDILFSVQRSKGRKPIVTMKKFYEKISDIDKVRILPRKVKGLITSGNRTNEVTPRLRPALPRKELMDKYKSFEQADKKSEIFALLDQIKIASNKLTGKNVDKLKTFAEHLVLNPDELTKAGYFNKTTKSWTFSKDAKDRYNYDRAEFKLIEKFVKEKFVENKNKESVLNESKSDSE